MTDADLIRAVGAFLLPLIVSVAQQPTWSDRQRAVVGFLAIWLWTALSLLFLDQVGGLGDWRSWARAFLTVTVATISAYYGFWKPSGVAPAIERATSPGGKPT